MVNDDDGVSLTDEQALYEWLKYKHSFRGKLDKWISNQNRKRWYTWAKWGLVFGLISGAAIAAVLWSVMWGW